MTQRAVEEHGAQVRKVGLVFVAEGGLFFAQIHWGRLPVELSGLEITAREVRAAWRG